MVPDAEPTLRVLEAHGAGVLDAIPGGLSTWLAIVYGLLLLERATEFLVDARHRRSLAARGGGAVGNDGFRAILFAQVLLFVLPLAEVRFATHTALGWWTWVGLALLVIAQVIRWWAVLSLGDRWTMRVFVVPGEPRVQRGPYRYTAHPNYAAVLVEYVALPLAFGAWWSLVVLLLVGITVTRVRVRIEERALRQAAGA